MLLAVGLLLLAACGSSNTVLSDQDPTSGSSLPAMTCERLLLDRRLQGEGHVVLEVDTGNSVGCSVEFGAGSGALASLGIATDCPDWASIMVAFDLDPDGHSFVLDRQETAQLDNGVCGIRIGDGDDSLELG